MLKFITYIIASIMNDPHMLQTLFAYNQHANQQVIRALQQYGVTHGKPLALYSHILNAHHTWIARIHANPATYGIWQTHAWPELATLDQANHQQTTVLLQEPHRLDDRIAYTNSSGQSFTNSLQDILWHIVNHSTYHRGQIAAALRALGYDPPATDYIFYRRNQL